MTDSHRFEVQIAFSDCDPAQIVFFANYFRWFDAAGRAFFTARGVPGWRDTEAQRGIIGTPLVDAQARFLNSATYGETLEIESRVEEWRNKSFVMTHRAWRDDTPICEGREVRVFAIRDPDDPLRIRAIPVPEDIRTLCA